MEGQRDVKVDGGGGALRHYTYYRPTILVLLKERESYGYELSSRMTELGFDQRVTASLYSVLRDMENEDLITSVWDVSDLGGPPRRMYAITVGGEQYLRDTMPMVVRQRQALGSMLALYAALDHQ